jgi:hypothetical protein
MDGGREFQWLPLLDRDVADVWRVHGFHSTLAQRIVHGTGHQLVDDVVQNLAAETLLDDTGGHLARPEPGDACGLAVVARHTIDLRVDHATLDLDVQILARLADVNEFGLHEVRGTNRGSAGCGVLRKGGVEPPWPHGHRILSPARLPVPPLSHAGGCDASVTWPIFGGQSTWVSAARGNGPPHAEMVPGTISQRATARTRVRPTTTRAAS